MGKGSYNEPWYEVVAKGVVNVFVLALSFSIFMVFFLGSYDFFKNVEENKCEMTYMFEFPQFVQLKLGSEIDIKYPMYGLYAYAEGKHIEAARNLRFTGIPVLFLPGNAGSYKQVRSFASVALRKWLDSRTPFHFDFFTIDFNEEFSGMYGYVLDRQSEYSRKAVDKISSFYEDYHQVVIIGHSMGGVIAKAINLNEPVVHLIYTFSTPHLHPVVITDPEQDIFYYGVMKNWTTVSQIAQDNKGGITLVSVAGGSRDLVVPSKLTRWFFNDIHSATTAVPAVWASTDHLCIVWCKQFVLAVVRSLFDLVEYKNPNKYYAITEDPVLKKNVLHYQLVKRSSGKSYFNAHSPDLGIERPPGADWNELLVPEYCGVSSRRTTYLMFPLVSMREKVTGDPNKFEVVVLTTNTGAKNWIFGCTSQSVAGDTRYCSDGENLSHLGEIIPHFRRRRKVIHLNYTRISKYSHLIVRFNPYHLRSCVNLEVFDKEERSRGLSLKFDTQNKIFYNLTLPIGWDISRLFAWRVSATPEDSSKPCEQTHNSLGVFRHGNFTEHKFFKNDSLIVKFSDWTAKSANVLLYLEPSCKYSISVRLASLETAGQLFATYARLLPSFFASIVLMSLFYQEHHEHWKNFHRVLLANSYQLTIVPGFLVSLLLLVIPNDWPSMMDGPEYSALLPIFCYLVAYVLVLIVATGGWYAIIAFGHAVHAIFMKFVLTKLGERFARLKIPDPLTDIALEIAFSKFPVTIAVFIVSLAVGTCGAFGLAVVMVLYFIKLFKMYEDLLGDLWKAKIRNVSEGLSPINFQFSCAMLWFVVTALNIPSLVHWIKNFSYGPTPQWDLSLYLCLMLTPTIAILWQDFVPKFNPTLWWVHRFIFYVMGLCIVIWGTHRLYVICFILTMVLITTAVCQLGSSIAALASKKLPVDPEPSDADEEEEEEEESEESQSQSTSESKSAATDKEDLIESPKKANPKNSDKKKELNDSDNDVDEIVDDVDTDESDLPPFLDDEDREIHKIFRARLSDELSEEDIQDEKNKADTVEEEEKVKKNTGVSNGTSKHRVSFCIKRKGRKAKKGKENATPGTEPQNDSSTSETRPSKR